MLDEMGIPEASFEMDHAFDVDDLAQSLYLVLGGQEESSKHGEGVSLEEVERLETKLWAALSEVSRLKNNHASIHRLPPEILSAIFNQLQPPLNDSYPPFPLPKHCKRWIVVAGVCRYWREVVSATPSLWSTVRFRSMNDPTTQLALYTGNSPLRIFYSTHSRTRSGKIDGAISEAAIRAINKQAHRLQELHFSADLDLRGDVQMLETLSRLIHPAPNLEALSLIITSERDTLADDISQLFGGSTPNLRRLTLANMGGWLNSGLSKALTHLHIFNGDLVASYDSAHRALSACPELEELVLVGRSIDMMSNQNSEPMSLPITRLPRLRKLELGSWISVRNAARFVSHLAIPSSTTRSFWSLAPLEDDDPLFLLNASSRSAEEGERMDVETVVITSPSWMKEGVFFRNRTLYLVGDRQQINSVFSPSSSSITDDSASHSFSHFASTTKLVFLETSLDRSVYTHGHQWSDAMKRVYDAVKPTLAEITLGVYQPHRFQNLIANPLGMGFDDDISMAGASHHTSLPNLKRLNLYTEGVEEHIFDQSQKRARNLVDVTALVLFAQHLKSKGRMLEEVAIKLPEPAWSAKEQLAMVVGKVLDIDADSGVRVDGYGDGDIELGDPARDKVDLGALIRGLRDMVHTFPRNIDAEGTW